MTEKNSRSELLKKLPLANLKWIGRPSIDIGMACYIRIFGLRTIEAIKNHDYNAKPVMNRELFKALCYNNDYAPEWDEFKEIYSDFFQIQEDDSNKSCPGQQSLETVMVENNPAQEPQKVEKIEPGSVYGDTPNNVKQQPITFADLFNKSAQPFEIDGKLYKPHLELIDVDRD